MQTPDIAELLNDIRTVQYAPRAFLWVLHWANFIKIFLFLMGLGILIVGAIAIRRYFKSSCVALREIRNVRYSHQQGALGHVQALDKLVDILRTYFFKEFGIVPFSRAEQGLLCAVREFPVSKDLKKKTVFVLDSLKRARFARKNTSAQQLDTLFERAHAIVTLMQKDRWTQSKQ